METSLIRAWASSARIHCGGWFASAHISPHPYSRQLESDSFRPHNTHDESSGRGRAHRADGTACSRCHLLLRVLWEAPTSCAVQLCTSKHGRETWFPASHCKLNQHNHHRQHHRDTVHNTAVQPEGASMSHGHHSAPCRRFKLS